RDREASLGVGARVARPRARRLATGRAAWHSPMSRWSRVTALFEEALELDPDAREQLLTRAAESDAATAHEVRSLLETHLHAGSFLEMPAWATDPDLLTEALDAPHYEIGRQLGPYRLKEEI